MFSGDKNGKCFEDLEEITDKEVLNFGSSMMLSCSVSYTRDQL